MMTYREAAQILDHPHEHWDKVYLEWDDEYLTASDMAVGLLLEAAESEETK